MLVKVALVAGLVFAVLTFRKHQQFKPKLGKNYCDISLVVQSYSLFSRHQIVKTSNTKFANKEGNLLSFWGQKPRAKRENSFLYDHAQLDIKYLRLKVLVKSHDDL